MISGLARTSRCAAALVLLTGLSAQAATGPQAASAPSPVRQTMRELWKAHITPIEEQQDPAMQKAISEVRSIDGLHKEPASKPSEAASKPYHEESTDGLTVRRTISQPKLEELRKQVARNPQASLLMADSLFEAAQWESAEVVYQELLAGKPEEGNKDWFLLQMANCRRPRDPAGARAAYAQLLTECPDSRWASVAQQEIHLIDWTAVNNPQGVMDAAEGRTNTSRNAASSMSASGSASSVPATTTPASRPAVAATAASASSQTR